MNDPAQRFTNRVINYVKFREPYPPEAMALLRSECGLDPGCIIADIGSGSGLFTRPLLEMGYHVYAVEPNPAMRAAAEGLLAHYLAFHSVDGRAECTGLPDHSVDVVTCAQSFHWFDPLLAHAEFSRILKPGGHVFLVWHERLGEASPFMRAFEAMLMDYGTEYEQVDFRRVALPMLHSFFGHKQIRERSFPNARFYNWEGLRGRLLSTPFTPEPGHPDCPPMLRRLRQIFQCHERQGEVLFQCETRVFFAPLL